MVRAIGWVLPLAAGVGWEAAARAALVPINWFPPPTTTFATLAELTVRGELGPHIVATLVRLTLGFSLGVGLGTLLALGCGGSRRLAALVDPSIQALRSIPSLAWVPLFLLWLGIDETSKVALIALGAFFPVYLNLLSGLRAIDRRLVEVGRMHGYRGWPLAKRVLVPAALPAYVTGLRGGLGLAWMFVVAAELLGASHGLGYLLLDGQTTSRTDLVMAAIVAFAVLGKLSDALFQYAERRLQPWRAMF